MTKRHYVQLAEVFRTVFRQLKNEQVENTTQAKVVLVEMMKMLKADNPRFSQEIFINYIQAGLKGGEENAATASKAEMGERTVAQAGPLARAQYARAGDSHPRNGAIHRPAGETLH